MKTEIYTVDKESFEEMFGKKRKQVTLVGYSVKTIVKKGKMKN